MNLTLILFYVLAVAAVATAAGLLFSRNSVYAALFLVLNFATVAIFYLLLGAPFIALVQVTVYAGAIMVLFLFVIMLLGAEKLPRGQVLPWQRPLAIVPGSPSAGGGDLPALPTPADHGGPGGSRRRAQYHGHPANPGHGIIQPVSPAL